MDKGQVCLYVRDTVKILWKVIILSVMEQVRAEAWGRDMVLVCVPLETREALESFLFKVKEGTNAKTTPPCLSSPKALTPKWGSPVLSHLSSLWYVPLESSSESPMPQTKSSPCASEGNVTALRRLGVLSAAAAAEEKVWLILRSGEPCRAVFEPSGFVESSFFQFSVWRRKKSCVET